MRRPGPCQDPSYSITGGLRDVEGSHEQHIMYPCVCTEAFQAVSPNLPQLATSGLGRTALYNEMMRS